MQSKKIVVNAKSKLSKLLETRGMAYSLVQKMIRKKDIRVNGKKINEDIFCEQNDEVVYYVPDTDFSKYRQKIKILYEDENLIAIFKPFAIETQGDNVSISNIFADYFVVHRLDRNTEGILILAKNLESKKLLEEAFYNKFVNKNYTCLVYGKMQKKNELLKLFLFKDSKKSIVLVNSIQKPGYVSAITNYKVISQFTNLALIDVSLLTGRTHQIRASLNYVGHSVVGDNKYGDKTTSASDKSISKLIGGQCLTATKISFDFPISSKLAYLNNVIITCDTTWFEQIKQKFAL